MVNKNLTQLQVLFYSLLRVKFLNIFFLCMPMQKCESPPLCGPYYDLKIWELTLIDDGSKQVSAFLIDYFLRRLLKNIKFSKFLYYLLLNVSMWFFNSTNMYLLFPNNDWCQVWLKLFKWSTPTTILTTEIGKTLIKKAHLSLFLG